MYYTNNYIPVKGPNFPPLFEVINNKNIYNGELSLLRYIVLTIWLMEISFTKIETN